MGELVRLALAVTAIVGCAACTPRVEVAAPVAVPEARSVEGAPIPDEVLAPFEYTAWRGVSYGAYLTPTSDFVDDEGGVDVVFHFHAGQMSDREIRQSQVRAVFVSCGFGIGSGAYSDAFADASRFDRMIAELVKNLAKTTGRDDIHVRRLGLVSWSAGFGAVGKILAQANAYDRIDSVVLLDSLHATYLAPNPHTPAQGKARVDLRAITGFLRFARDAANGDKLMVITHSSIVPPDYASSREATAAMLDALGVETATPDGESWHGMRADLRADRKDLHVRGFRGMGPHDHFDHLHLVGEALGRYLVPRWKKGQLALAGARAP